MNEDYDFFKATLNPNQSFIEDTMPDDVWQKIDIKTLLPNYWEDKNLLKDKVNYTMPSQNIIITIKENNKSMDLKFKVKIYANADESKNIIYNVGRANYNLKRFTENNHIIDKVAKPIIKELIDATRTNIEEQHIEYNYKAEGSIKMLKHFHTKGDAIYLKLYGQILICINTDLNKYGFSYLIDDKEGKIINHGTKKMFFPDSFFNESTLFTEAPEDEAPADDAPPDIDTGGGDDAPPDMNDGNNDDSPPDMDMGGGDDFGGDDFGSDDSGGDDSGYDFGGDETDTDSDHDGNIGLDDKVSSILNMNLYQQYLALLREIGNQLMLIKANSDILYQLSDKVNEIVNSLKRLEENMRLYVKNSFTTENYSKNLHFFNKCLNLFKLLTDSFDSVVHKGIKNDK